VHKVAQRASIFTYKGEAQLHFHTSAEIRAPSLCLEIFQGTEKKTKKTLFETDSKLTFFAHFVSL